MEKPAYFAITAAAEMFTMWPLCWARRIGRAANDLQRAKSLEIARDRSGTEFLECANRPVTRVIDDNIEPIKGGSSVSHHSFHPLRVW